MSPRSLLAVVVALFACSATRAPQTAAQPVVVPAAVVAADVAVIADASPIPPTHILTNDTSADAGAPADATPPPDPRLARLRAFANGTIPMAEATDPAHGLAVVHYLEAPPSGEGSETISTQHHCGAALRRELPALRRVLAAIVEQSDGNDTFACDATECIVPGMEYQPAWHVLFLDVQGTPRIEAVMQLSEAAMGESWRTRMNEYVARSLTAARAHPCPMPRR
jgi:hypothetical protein